MGGGRKEEVRERLAAEAARLAGVDAGVAKDLVSIDLWMAKMVAAVRAGDAGEVASLLSDDMYASLCPGSSPELCATRRRKKAARRPSLSAESVKKDFWRKLLNEPFPLTVVRKEEQEGSGGVEETRNVTFLSMAAYHQNVDIVKLLMSKGATDHERVITHAFDLCRNALNYAIASENVEIVRVLLSPFPDLGRRGIPFPYLYRKMFTAVEGGKKIIRCNALMFAIMLENEEINKIFRSKGFVGFGLEGDDYNRYDIEPDPKAKLEIPSNSYSVGEEPDSPEAAVDAPFPSRRQFEERIQNMKKKWAELGAKRKIATADRQRLDSIISRYANKIQKIYDNGQSQEATIDALDKCFNASKGELNLALQIVDVTWATLSQPEKAELIFLWEVLPPPPKEGNEGAAPARS